jgi:Na+-translocating ferredoxin:NAD+ oxidoreductase RnfD subunit
MTVVAGAGPRPLVAPVGRSVTIGARRYPVVLPRLTDPRLHLAAVILTLHVIGQTALRFDLSIAQILVALGTAGLLEAGITFARHRVIAWPASGLVAGNSVAFILRVTGTEHGDWWSLHGGWIFAATAAGAVLSKHLVRVGGRHLFNPSNVALVVCFLLLGSSRVEPLDFWWGPMSPGLAAALAVITAGGFLILRRLRMLAIAVTFWVTFAAALGLLAASGHCMTARWHLGPICDGAFWWVIVTSPEILVFLFFMITDPRTAPVGRVARGVYASAVAALAVLLIAPNRTEWASKVAVLGALTIVCALRPLLERRLPLPGTPGDDPRRYAAAALGWRRGLRPAALRTSAAGLVVLVFAALLVTAGSPVRRLDPAAGTAAAAAPPTPPIDAAPRPVLTLPPGAVPPIRVDLSERVASSIDQGTADEIARHLTENLVIQADALRRADPRLAAAAADWSWLEVLRARITRARRDGEVVVPTYRLQRAVLAIARRPGQAAPAVMVTFTGTRTDETWRPAAAGRPAARLGASRPQPVTETYEVAWLRDHYLIVSDQLPPRFTPPVP